MRITDTDLPASASAAEPRTRLLPTSTCTYPTRLLPTYLPTYLPVSITGTTLHLHYTALHCSTLPTLPAYHLPTCQWGSPASPLPNPPATYLYLYLYLQLQLQLPAHHLPTLPYPTLPYQ